jgi:membrane protein YqaA with SNARE-associated domain
MSETSSKREPDQGETEDGFGRVYLLTEVVAVVAFVGIVFWLAHNWRPRTLFGRGLLDTNLWLLVLLVSAWGTAGSLIPYYVGQRGTKAVFEHYPRLEGRPWERLETVFQRWGAFALILSGIPGVGAALLVAAGAFGIQKSTFLFWVFLGKVLRYWVVVFIVLASLQVVG